MIGVVNVHAMTGTYSHIVREIATHVQVGDPFDPAEFRDVLPRSGDLKAVWDTGATGTSISASLAKSLSLEGFGETAVQGVTGTAVCTTYFVSLHLPNGVVIPQLEVCDLEGNIGCDVLIGMDVIGRGDFAITNHLGKTTFSFRMPSIEKIDFIAQRPQGYEKFQRNSKCPCGSGKKYKKCCGK